MAKIKPFISSVVSRQLPEHIREDYPTFVNFIEAYYEYVDNNHNGRNLKDYKDIDDTLDSFLQYFNNELNVLVDTDFPNYPNINSKEFLLKRAKQYFSAKGSESAYKFLFRALYGKEVELYYPGQNMLRSSDGKWQQDRSFFITIDSGDVNDLIGNEIYVYSPSGVLQFVTFVERYSQFSSSVYEIFVSRYQGTAEEGQVVKYTNPITSVVEFTGTILNTLGTYEVTNGGANFKVGQIFDINSVEVQGARIKVTQVSSTGAIEKIKIIKFGGGYATRFVANIAPFVSDFDDPSPISVDLNSVQEFESPSNSYTAGFSEVGNIINCNYYDISYGDPAYAGTLLGEFSNVYTYLSDTENVASIRFFLDAVAVYDGYYSTNDGFISDAVFIQDSFYYQAFSYVVQITELLESYVDLVKSYMHPSGTALFGEYLITNNFDLNTTVGPAEITTRLYLSDNFSLSDAVPAFAYYPTFSDSLSLSDSTPSQTYFYTFSDSFTLSDSTANHVFLTASDSYSLTDLDFDALHIVTQSLTDSLSIVETINNIDSEKLFTETLAPSELLEYSLDTPASESITPSETGNIYFNTYSEGTYFAEDYSQSDSSAAATF